MLLAVILVILGLYRETALSMAVIWARSETFAHGFLVLPISLWLIWRIRNRLAALEPSPCFWTLPLLAGAGFMWLLGEMATVAPLSQFSLIAMLVLTVPAILGLHLARQIMFPLGFLFFAVPFGEFAMPQLMEWTANVTVLGLRLSGIPVYREGLHFVIPSGNWSVVEACSGVRYLIASLMVGTLFAYLSYRTPKRRLIFVGVSFLVPVVANWMRAYMIVMLGHLSGNKLAAGVDHLIYGWLFFGLVIMAMFWIGAHWQEEDSPVSRAFKPVRNPATAACNRRGLLSVAMMTIAVLALWPFAEWQIERNVPPDVPRIETIGAIPGWNDSPESLVEWKPHYENASSSTQAEYLADGKKVGLYLAYYRNQGTDRKMVTSTNVLVPTNDPYWLQVVKGRRKIASGGETIDVRTAELRGANASRLMVWQWYWVNGRLMASDSLVKAWTAFSRLTGQGDDSAAIFVYAPMDMADGSDAALESFVRAAGPAIEKALGRTRENQ